MQPYAAPDRGRGFRNVLIAALVSALATGAVYFFTRSDASAPAPSPPDDRAPADSAPVVPGDESPAPVPVPPEGNAFLRDVVRQLRAQLAELRADLRAEEDPATRDALRAQIQAVREGIEQLEHEIAAS